MLSVEQEPRLQLSIQLAYCRLPLASHLLPVAYCLLPVASCLLTVADGPSRWASPTFTRTAFQFANYCLLNKCFEHKHAVCRTKPRLRSSIAYCLLSLAYSLLPFAFCLLPFAADRLPVAYDLISWASPTFTGLLGRCVCFALHSLTHSLTRFRL